MVIVSASNAVKLSDVQTEFGGTNPIKMSEYYANATEGYTSTAVGPAPSIPNANSPFQFSMFWGKMKENEKIFATAGTFTWTVPSGVTSISIVCVGGGGNGAIEPDFVSISSKYIYCGGGGGLAWINNYSVIAGTTYNIVVGGAGSSSSFKTSANVNIATANGGTIGAGGNYIVNITGIWGGGNGGTGGTAYSDGNVNASAGAGGAGGYLGNGGNGGFNDGYGTILEPTAGTGGAGGGGNKSGGAGGGVGLYGQGTNGAGGGFGGSGGGNANGAQGGLYGGGGAIDGGGGAGGAVRIKYNGTIGPGYTNHTFTLPAPPGPYMSSGTYTIVGNLNTRVTGGSGFITYSITQNVNSTTARLVLSSTTLSLQIDSNGLVPGIYSGTVRATDTRNGNYAVNATYTYTISPN